MPKEFVALRGDGRLGLTLTVAGVACLAGLVGLALALTGSSGWGLMHNGPVVFFLGMASIVATLLWFIVAVIAAVVRRKHTWLIHELFLLLILPITFVATVTTLK